MTTNIGTGDLEARDAVPIDTDFLQFTATWIFLTSHPLPIWGGEIIRNSYMLLLIWGLHCISRSGQHLKLFIWMPREIHPCSHLVPSSPSSPNREIRPHTLLHPLFPLSTYQILLQHSILKRRIPNKIASPPAVAAHIQTSWHRPFPFTTTTITNSFDKTTTHLLLFQPSSFLSTTN